MKRLEKYLLSTTNCSSSANLNDDQEVGPEPFYSLFFISGGISAFAFLVTIVRLAQKGQLKMTYMPARLVDGNRVWMWAIIFLARIYIKFPFPYRIRI